MPPAAHHSYSLFTLHYSLVTTCGGISSLAVPESWVSRQEIFSPPRGSSPDAPHRKKTAKPSGLPSVWGREHLNRCRLRHTASIHCSLFTIHLQPPAVESVLWRPLIAVWDRQEIFSPPHFCASGKMSAQPKPRIEKDGKAIRPAVCIGRESSESVPPAAHRSYSLFTLLFSLASPGGIAHSGIPTYLPGTPENCSPPGAQRNPGIISLPGCVRQGKAPAQPAARELLPARAPEKPRHNIIAQLRAPG